MVGVHVRPLLVPDCHPNHSIEGIEGENWDEGFCRSLPFRGAVSLHQHQGFAYAFLVAGAAVGLRLRLRCGTLL
jgi:hypothetical protein